MNNPLSTDPRHALAPYPAGSAGHRLWRMLQAVRPELFRADYLRAFDRRNLLPGLEWSAARAREAVRGLELPRGSTVVVLGDEVRRALSLERCLVHPRHSPDFPEEDAPVFRQLPHPSGRNLFYNSPAHRLIAGLLLSDLFDLSTGLA
jgi:hypothetical protein